MVQRQCPKCKALFNQKGHYDYHINRKFVCSKNKSVDNEEHNLCQNMPFCAEIVPKYAILGTKTNLEQENEKIPEKNEKNPVNNQVLNRDLCCQYCWKNFSSKSTLTRHLKSNCKVKKENDEEKENIFKLLLEKDLQHKEEVEELKKHNEKIIKCNNEEVSELKKQNKLLMDKINKLITINSKSAKSSKTTNTNSNNTITNTNTNTNTNNNQKITTNTQNNNNIVMVNFGKEDLSIIDEKQFIDRIVKKPTVSGVKIPDEVLKIIHFNPQYPQLSNIYISDINREKCMVYEDGEWKLSNVNNIPQIMDKVCVFSSEQISNLRIKHPDNKPLEDRLNTIEKYNNMIDGDYVDDLRDDGRQVEIAKCEEFQAHAYNTLKKTMYNEGKKLKKTMKLK